ncbi:hypothetical protein [Corynebacterium mastitidis]|uniref:hypothetical protein n=1 Tax=Corynebacterium mastitidis TaxID=161890 RepID=UPI0003754AF2|nr:hypothetical protein [Corynebacterium mastitidis]
MTPQEAIRELRPEQIAALKMLAGGKKKPSEENLRDLEKLGLIIEIDGRWLTTTLGSYTLKAHSDMGRK